MKKVIGQQGFTLVEILVAMTLVVLIFTLIPTSNSNQQRENLEKALFELERASRFAINESILRNNLVRISINLNAQPQTFTVEYATVSDVVLEEEVDESRLSVKEQEKLLQKKEELSGQFSSVPEFAEKPKEIPRFVEITGFASDNTKNIISTGEVNIHFYPTGERDAAIIFFSTEEEFASLNISSFENRFFKDFKTYTPSELNNYEATLMGLMEEKFQLWLRE